MSIDNFDDFLKEKPKASAPKKKASPDFTWNVLTALMLVMTMCACIVFFSIYSNPYSSLNPFIPNTPIPPPATATWTPVSYEATWTPTVTVPPTETSTPRPTYTEVASSTAFTVKTATPNYTPTPAPTATKTPRPTGVPYNISVTYNDSVTFNAATSCSSMYVAGQALDAKNKPVFGLQVKLGGSLPGKVFTNYPPTLTGLAGAYGQSGFEFDLKIAPVASNNALWIQLYDQSGAPLSEQTRLTTYSDCKRNLVLVRFQQK
jgi:hypothetical protein